MYKTTVRIDGMTCGMCEAHMNDTIRKAFPVKKVTSSKAKGTSVVISDQPLDEGGLKSAIEATGYTYVSMQEEPYQKTGLFRRG